MKTLSLVVCLGIAASLASGSQLQAQAPSGKTFEVASVKPSNPNPANQAAGLPMALPPAGGRFRASNMPLRLLIRAAYELPDFRISGGPDWQMTRKFDIEAKAEDPNLTLKAMYPMLRALLAERFQLKTHMETRQLPIYALVIARSDGKLGPDIKPSTSNCSDPQSGQLKIAEAVSKGGPAAAMLREPLPCSMIPAPAIGGFALRANGQDMAQLALMLTQLTGRVVADKTGLTGQYDFDLKFDPEILMRLVSQLGVNTAGVNLPPSDNPSLFTALQENLGLKLDSQRGPVEVLVIDSAEPPTPD